MPASNQKFTVRIPLSPAVSFVSNCQNYISIPGPLQVDFSATAPVRRAERILAFWDVEIPESGPPVVVSRVKCSLMSSGKEKESSFLRGERV